MERPPNIVVVDDEPTSASYMALALAELGGEVRTAGNGVEALLAIEKEVPDLVVSDLRMPQMDGLELLDLIKQRWPRLPVILVTVENETSTIVEAVRGGATNYLVKPIPPPALLAAARRATSARRQTESGDMSMREIVGDTPAMVRVRHLIALASISDVNVLVTGETGTGKELVARAIHRLSPLSDGPFVANNCALIPADLFDSAFFGHCKGAFTGADRDHSGLLRQSHDGVLFLDELECLGLPHQAKLLRVLDDGEVRPVGSSKVHRVSVRFLAATNSEPSQMLEARTLRDDLYYRLRGFRIDLPPLRERTGDIPSLACHFLDGEADRVSRAAMDALCDGTWPGNVRQLRNVLRAASNAAGKGPIEPRHLALDGVSRPAVTPTSSRRGRTLQHVEQRAILAALEEDGGNQSRAARRLGIDRSTLRRKLKQLDAG